uniref:Uncharacterized protein n=1 Tax=Octopus bimaculoides TaxID=37653 RepID=A0A0L8GWT6_OCTBM
MFVRIQWFETRCRHVSKTVKEIHSTNLAMEKQKNGKQNSRQIGKNGWHKG